MDMSERKPEHTDTFKAYDCPILINQEHPKAKDYFTEQDRNSKNSSVTTKATAINHSWKVLNQQNSLTIPCGRRPKH
jgi:hypothetical protein